MKFIIKLLLLSIVLSAIFSKKLKNLNRVVPVAIAAAVLAEPEKFAKAVESFVNAVAATANIPNTFIKGVTENRKLIFELRKQIGTAIMINSTNDECKWRCKDEKDIFSHVFTIRGKSTGGPNSIINISSSGTNPGMRCYVIPGNNKEKGPYTLIRGETYIWSGTGTTLTFISK